MQMDTMITKFLFLVLASLYVTWSCKPIKGDSCYLDVSFNGNNHCIYYSKVEAGIPMNRLFPSIHYTSDSQSDSLVFKLSDHEEKEFFLSIYVVDTCKLSEAQNQWKKKYLREMMFSENYIDSLTTLTIDTLSGMYTYDHNSYWDLYLHQFRKLSKCNQLVISTRFGSTFPEKYEDIYRSFLDSILIEKGACSGRGMICH